MKSCQFQIDYFAKRPASSFRSIQDVSILEDTFLIQINMQSNLVFNSHPWAKGKMTP